MKKPIPQLIKGKPSTPWRVRIPKAFVLADPLTGKKRDLRKFFPHKADALDYINRLFTLGYAKADWREQTLENGKLPVSDAVSDFLMRRYRPDQVTNNRTLVQERQILGAFVKRFRNTPLDNFTHRDVDSWLRGLDKAPQTVANHFAIVRRFFNWCEKEELLTVRNPIKRAEKPKVPYTFPTTITPDAMGKLLAAAKELMNEQPAEPWRQMLAYLCIGGFAGVRTSEIKRLQWEEINWQADETDENGKPVYRGWVHVHKSKRVVPRNVEILPVLRRHLEPIALESSPVFSMSSQKEADMRIELERRAGVEMPHNCLRHSFASYHIAMWRDYVRTAFEMGHTSPRMTEQKYVVVIPKVMAEKWWAL
jgi:integrase